jgi:hypothetical protein
MASPLRRCGLLALALLVFSLLQIAWNDGLKLTLLRHSSSRTSSSTDNDSFSSSRLLLGSEAQPQHLEWQWNWQGTLALALSTVNSIASAATGEAAAAAAVPDHQRVYLLVIYVLLLSHKQLSKCSDVAYSTAAACCNAVNDNHHQCYTTSDLSAAAPCAYRMLLTCACCMHIVNLLTGQGGTPLLIPIFTGLLNIRKQPAPLICSVCSILVALPTRLLAVV